MIELDEKDLEAVAYERFMAERKRTLAKIGMPALVPMLVGMALLGSDGGLVILAHILLWPPVMFWIWSLWRLSRAYGPYKDHFVASAKRFGCMAVIDGVSVPPKKHSPQIDRIFKPRRKR